MIEKVIEKLNNELIKNQEVIDKRILGWQRKLNEFNISDNVKASAIEQKVKSDPKLQELAQINKAFEKAIEFINGIKNEQQ